MIFWSPGRIWQDGGRIRVQNILFRKNTRSRCSDGVRSSFATYFPREGAIPSRRIIEGITRKRLLPSGANSMFFSLIWHFHSLYWLYLVDPLYTARRYHTSQEFWIRMTSLSDQNNCHAFCRQSRGMHNPSKKIQRKTFLMREELSVLLRVLLSAPQSAATILLACQLDYHSSKTWNRLRL